MAAAGLLQRRRPGGHVLQRGSVAEPHVAGAGERPASQQLLPFFRLGAPFQAQPRRVTRRRAADGDSQSIAAHGHGIRFTRAGEGTCRRRAVSAGKVETQSAGALRGAARRCLRDGGVHQHPARGTVRPAAVDAGLRVAGSGSRRLERGARGAVQHGARDRHPEPQRQPRQGSGGGAGGGGQLQLCRERPVRRRRSPAGAHGSSDLGGRPILLGRSHLHRVGAIGQQRVQRQGVQRRPSLFHGPDRCRARSVRCHFQGGGRVGDTVHGGCVAGAACGDHFQGFDRRRERTRGRALGQQCEALEAARAAAGGGGLHPLHRGVEADRALQHQQVAAVVVPVRGDHPHRLGTEADLEGQLLAGGVVRQ